jgi:hypothetical protein
MNSRFATGLPGAGAEFQLPCCSSCNRVSYPIRELCGHCLADALIWRTVDANGTVQSVSTLQYSLEPVYTQHLPWTIASVLLDCGSVALAHSQPGLTLGDRCVLRICSDGEKNRLLVACVANDPESGAADWLQSIGYEETAA